MADVDAIIVKKSGEQISIKDIEIIYLLASKEYEIVYAGELGDNPLDDPIFRAKEQIDAYAKETEEMMVPTTTEAIWYKKGIKTSCEIIKEILDKKRTFAV